jgi:polysaccharide pyruvyl transferase WcaK-like protein
MKKAIILGWYGHGNAGDECYKIALPKFLTDYQCTFTDEPKEDVDLFVLGGGHVVLNDFIDKIRTKTNKVILSATVVENAPFHKLHDFKRIMVRDVRSKKNLNDHGINCELVPDLAFLLSPDAKRGKEFIKKCFVGKDLYEKVVTVVLNAHLTPPSDEFLARDFSNFHYVVDRLAQVFDSTSASFLFLPFGCKEPFDDRVTNGWLASRCKFHQKNVVVYEQLQPQTLIDVIACSDVVISTRFHASVFSCLGGTPFIDITHHSKNQGFLETINRCDWSIPYWQFDANKCASLLKELLDTRYREDLRLVSKLQTDRINDVHRI